MSGRVAIVIIAVLIAVVVIGGIAGYMYVKKGPSEPEEIDKFAYTTEEMFCNIKNSKRIVKITISVATTEEKNVEKIADHSYLIRDTANKIIRNTTEEELQGNEGQINLQEKIMNELVGLMPDDGIVDVYFDDFVIQ